MQLGLGTAIWAPQPTTGYDSTLVSIHSCPVNLDELHSPKEHVALLHSGLCIHLEMDGRLNMLWLVYFPVVQSHMFHDRQFVDAGQMTLEVF